MDHVRPLPTRSPREHAQRRLVDLSSSNPIRWRPCADPVQKRDPASGQRKKGLTDQRPLQKGGQSVACPPILRRTSKGGHGACAFAHPTILVTTRPPIHPARSGSSCPCRRSILRRRPRCRRSSPDGSTSAWP